MPPCARPFDVPLSLSWVRRPPARWSRACDWPLHLWVSNPSDRAVEMPWSFLKRRGPVLSLRNPQTGQTWPLHAGPPDSERLSERVTWPPGHRERLDWIVSAAELQQACPVAGPLEVWAEAWVPMAVEGEPCTGRSPRLCAQMSLD